MEERNSFTNEELAIAKSVDLTAVAENLGYTVSKVGNYHTLKEMDSIRIYDRRSWFRWSQEYQKGENGGSQIDFLRVFAGMDIKEAVFWLLDFAGYRKTENWKTKEIIVTKKETERKPFLLPNAALDNRYLYRYLIEERHLSKEVVDWFVKTGLIYEESRYHNIVFKGNDKSGVTHFASMRGVFDRNGKCFKCDVTGNDKNYGFNVWNMGNSEVAVFEGAIDLMSYTDMYYDFKTNKLALGMLSDAPLVRFLQEHLQIGKIKFCLDNDSPGRKAAEMLMEKYYQLGYEVEDCPPPSDYKDYNMWLQELRKEDFQQIRKMEKAR